MRPVCDSRGPPPPLESISSKGGGVMSVACPRKSAKQREMTTICEGSNPCSPQVRAGYH